MNTTPTAATARATGEESERETGAHRQVRRDERVEPVVEEVGDAARLRRRERVREARERREDPRLRRRVAEDVDDEDRIVSEKAEPRDVRRSAGGDHRPRAAMRDERPHVV